MLSVYAAYCALLAVNGVSEAFVHATADKVVLGEGLSKGGGITQLLRRRGKGEVGRRKGRE